MSQRIRWMDALRGAMIILVILFHGASRVERYDDGALSWVTHFNLFWEPFRMPMLVFLSGMLLARSLSKQRAVYVIGKVRQLLWPYVLWSLAFLILLGATGAGSDTEGPLWHQLLGILSGTATYLWFLSFLFVFYIISMFVSERARALLIPVTILSAAVLQIVPEAYQGQKFLFLLGFFWLGDLASRRELVDSRSLRSSWVLCFAVLLAGVTGVLASFEIVGRYAPLTAVGVVAGIVCLIAAARALSNSRIEAVLAMVGRDTIVFYASHYLIIAVVYFVLNRLFDVDSPWLLFTAGVAGAVLGGSALVWGRHRSRLIDWLFVLPWPRTRERAARR